MIPLQKQDLSQRMNLIRTFVILLLCCTTQSNASTHSVQTFRTSSTQLGQLMTSSTLNWESYANDKKQLEYAIKGGNFHTGAEQHHPIYVCRATVEGLYVSGHTEKRGDKLVCVVSLLGDVKTHHAFDVIVNKGHLGKISWKPWRKFNAATPIGAISVSSTEITYVARHRNNKHHQKSHHEGHELHGTDFNLGRFDPSMGLGKILVAEGEYEKEYEEGEILVETEPFRYELKNIKINKFKMDTKVNSTELGSAVLSNTGDSSMMVESVISYKYDRSQYWGAHEGVARGLPTRIYEIEKSDEQPDEIKWGLRYSEVRVETKTVNTKLLPGTAMNVTLKGNYTSFEAPYTATLIAYYNGNNEDKVTRKIAAVVQKANLRDIRLEFSPVYWIENGTFIPTTTTTTTTTTSTTTEATTTSTKEPKPLTEPQVILSDIGRSSLSDNLASSSSSRNTEFDDSQNTINQSGEVEKLKDPKNASNSIFSNFTLILMIISSTMWLY